MLGLLLRGLAGALIGIPALRIKGHYLVMLTLAFGEIVRLLLTNLEGLTGGSEGITGIPAPALTLGILYSRQSLSYVLLVFAVLAVLGMVMIDRSLLRKGVHRNQGRGTGGRCERCPSLPYQGLSLCHAVYAVWPAVSMRTLFTHQSRILQPRSHYHFAGHGTAGWTGVHHRFDSGCRCTHCSAGIASVYPAVLHGGIWPWHLATGDVSSRWLGQRDSIAKRLIGRSRGRGVRYLIHDGPRSLG